jgi:recombination protein RecT
VSEERGLVKFQEALTDKLPQIRALLPDNMDERRFARIAMGFFNSKAGEALAKCTPESFVNTMLQIAELNLEPVLGMAYPVPFKGVVTLIIGYQGMIELAYRSGLVRAMSAVVVHEGDEFEVDYGTSPGIHHRKTADKGAPLTHVYAWAQLMTGGLVFVVLDKDDVKKRRDVAKTTKVWDAWPEEMGMKTALRALFKIVPKSPQMQAAAVMGDDDARPVPARRQQGVQIPSTSEPLPWEHTDEPDPGECPTDGAFEGDK